MKKTTMLLTVMFVLILAGSAAAALSVEGSAVPLPTPERAMNAEQINQLLDELQHGLSNHIDDDSSIEAISKKWDAHTDLAGKSRSQILPLLMADVKMVVTDKETGDAIWASWNDANDEPAPATAPAAVPKNDGASSGGWVTMINQGFFMANFDATWDGPGHPGQKFHSENKNKGYQETLTFAPGDKNIHLHVTNLTGLVWEPSRVVFDRTLTAADMNKCLTLEGMAGSATFRFGDCDDSAGGNKAPGAEDKTPAGAQTTETWLGLSHDGAYIAHFNVSWNEPGKAEQMFQSDSSVGFKKALKFPRGASNFRIKITNDTGLAWEPTHEIINRHLAADELNKCVVIDGSAPAPKIRFESCDPPPTK